MVVRRIVKCSSCLKRFATASGQGLCPSCRPPLAVRAKSNNHSIVNSAATDADAPPNQMDALQSPPTESSQTDQFGGKKRKQATAAITVDDVFQVCNTVAAAPSIQQSVDESNSGTLINNDNSETEIIIDTNKKSPAEEDRMTKKPKTCDDETKIIASPKKTFVPKSLDKGCHEGDDLLRCITNSSTTTDLNDELESHVANNYQLKGKMEGDGSCCASENDDLLECIEIDEDHGDEGGDNNMTSRLSQEEAASDEEVNQPQVNQKDNSEKPDVCYICGSNLSGKGFTSRVAHMKRCTTKYGETMKTSSEEVEDIMVPFESSKAESAKWHGYAGRNIQQSKEKQSMLNQFFKAPVRSLTNVLMAGSRQASKKKVEPSSVTNNAGKKPSYRKGSWSSNNRRGGQCPSYKRIPGTDFLCDGFYYAGSLTQNYFLTHFHSDHYGGITKKWNEGIIYCSVSIIFSLSLFWKSCLSLSLSDRNTNLL